MGRSHRRSWPGGPPRWARRRWRSPTATGCTGWPTAMGRHDAAVASLGPWREAFGHDLFVEVRDRLEPGGAEAIRRMMRLIDGSGVPGVATNGVRYLVPEDAFLADVLECMREI